MIFLGDNEKSILAGTGDICRELSEVNLKLDCTRLYIMVIRLVLDLRQEDRVLIKENQCGEPVQEESQQTISERVLLQ